MQLSGSRAFVAELKEKRRLALCCSYFKSTHFGAHHVALYDFLRRNGFVILNVHALGGAMLVDPHCGARIDCSIVKVNKGYDFGSWLVGFAATVDYWDVIDKLVFVNDSVIGPMTGSVPIFAEFLEKQEGLFGITDSYAHNYHVQSYFFGVGSDRASRDLLADFFLAFNPSSDKSETINNGELGLGRKMGERGITPSVFCPYDQVVDAWLADVETLHRDVVDSMPFADEAKRAAVDSAYNRIIDEVMRGTAVNPTHYFWYPLMEKFHQPFVKRELLFKNPTQIPDRALIMRYLRENCVDTYEQALALARTSGDSLFPPVLTVKHRH
jgi:hypothetical protein